MLRLATPAARDNLPLGTSICVNGACMTVSSTGEGWFGFDLSPETQKTTTLGTLPLGVKVNLERPLQIGDLFAGHIGLGHFDAVGSVLVAAPDLRVRIPADLMRYCVEKGSIALDGVSLTVFDLEKDSFSVAIIPFTSEHATLGAARPGDFLNVEVDVVAKQIERLASSYVSRGDD